MSHGPLMGPVTGSKTELTREELSLGGGLLFSVVIVGIGEGGTERLG